jgi:hypothetical protein
VQRGGALYASLASNSAIPDMAELFGARMTDTVIDNEVTLKIVRPLGSLRPGDSLHFMLPGGGGKFWGTGLQVADGEVIAVDQKQRPALVAHRYGKGYTLLSAYPIEAWLGSQPAAFDGTESTHRLYRAMREWAGIRPLVATDQASVEASALTSPTGGYFVLANHEGRALRTHLDTSLPATGLRQLTEGGTVAVSAERGGWTLELPAHGGAVIQWQRRPQ